MEAIMKRIGLPVNEQKTRLVKVPEESLDFLGYTIGCFHGRDGSRTSALVHHGKAIRRLLEVIHEQTSSQWNASSPELRVEALNQKLRAWPVF
jgi:hypothetical protein